MAPPLVALEDMSLRQGGSLLFDGLSLQVGPADRLALIGRNGAGKTTLFRLLDGSLEPDRGRRIVRPSARVVTLAQDLAMDGFRTLADFATSGAGAPPAHAVAAVADQLGLDLGRPAATASGGERRRAAIARALASAPDLLLLDEPTNHLDISGIAWLEAWLARYAGAFVVISHDRAFLSRLTRACLWLDRGRLRRREVGFGGFEAWSEEVLAEEARAAERLDQKLAQELEWLHRGVTARRRRNQGRLAKLEALRAERRAMLGTPGVAKLGLKADEAKARMVIEAEGVSKTLGGRTVIRDLSIRILRGDRIGIVGANGTGKTTLLRLLTGDLAPDSGTIRRAAGLTGIAIDQQRALLDPAKRVRDVLADGSDWVMVRGVRTHARGYLKQFLFPPDALDAKIGSFSGGERARLLLAREFAREASLLVLDEPTNDLDLETLDLLQEVIADFEGTVLLVSHDRDFLDRTVTMTCFLDGSGKVELVAGGHAELERLQQGRAQEPPPRRSAPPASGPSLAAPSAARAGAQEQGRKLSFRDRHDLERLPAEIARLEALRDRLEAELADPGLYGRAPDRFAVLGEELAAVRTALARAEDRWLEVAAKAEALGG
ncbi:ABC-F family ATP-binding cassette domain-containing protein [Thermaurantiacus tibetensis]|uniref:ABC-F family ATP-binding cassette domain-containing protein n=1 Tax=Thermaurantiacus tibetensis TaxID=2759035 RepID=UPI00188EDE54|nr:ABC-F family ATP-binding cassette domain-containing protein [Thermaurantiacus tibetensis]